jgi:hypothetical protein
MSRSAHPTAISADSAAEIRDACQADYVAFLHRVPFAIDALTLGWSIGGVPPICHDSDVPVLFDPTLGQFDTICAAAGTPEALFPIDPVRLKRPAGADEHPVAADLS